MCYFKQIALSLLILSFTACATPQVKKLETPSWVETGKDARYPARLYITAEGMGDTKEQADRMAIQKIAEQIQVSIKGSLTDIQRETKKGGKIEVEYDIDRRIETSVDIERLEGLSIAGRYRDERNMHHSLAVLDRGKASRGLEREVKESHELVRKYLEMAEAHREKKETVGIIQNYAKAINELKRIRSREDLLYAISGNEVKGNPSLPDIKKRLIEAMLDIKVSVDIKVSNMGIPLKSPSVGAVVIEGLADLGLNIVPLEELSNADVLIKITGEVNTIKKGELNNIVFAVSDASVNITDSRTRVVIKAVNIKSANFKDNKGYDTKGSGMTAEAAGLNSIKKTGDIIREEVVKAFNENFLGDGNE